MNYKRICFLATFAALTLGATTGNASLILYSHTFDGGSGSLSAVAPDTANTGIILGADHGTTTANWDVSSNQSNDFLQNGNIGNKTIGILDFNPIDGYVYTITATSTTNVAWTAIGFGDVSLQTNAAPLFFQTGIAWALKTDTVVSAQFDPNGGVAGQTPTGPVSSTTAEWSIVLDTRDGGALWDVSYFADGSSTAFLTLPDIGTTAANSIDIIGFQSEGSGTNNFESFSLTVAVPEPSSAIFLGLGAGLLIFLQRRRRYLPCNGVAG